MHSSSKQIVRASDSGQGRSSTVLVVSLCLAAFLALGLSSAALAQSITGTILGTVRDSSAAVIQAPKS